MMAKTEYGVRSTPPEYVPNRANLLIIIPDKGFGLSIRALRVQPVLLSGFKVGQRKGPRRVTWCV